MYMHLSPTEESRAVQMLSQARSRASGEAPEEPPEEPPEGHVGQHDAGFDGTTRENDDWVTGFKPVTQSFQALTEVSPTGFEIASIHATTCSLVKLRKEFQGLTRVKRTPRTVSHNRAVVA